MVSVWSRCRSLPPTWTERLEGSSPQSSLHRAGSSARAKHRRGQCEASKGPSPSPSPCFCCDSQCHRGRVARTCEPVQDSPDWLCRVLRGTTLHYRQSPLCLRGEQGIEYEGLRGPRGGRRGSPLGAPPVGRCGRYRGPPSPPSSVRGKEWNTNGLAGR